MTDPLDTFRSYNKVKSLEMLVKSTVSKSEYKSVAMLEPIASEYAELLIEFASTYICNKYNICGYSAGCFVNLTNEELLEFTVRLGEIGESFPEWEALINAGWKDFRGWSLNHLYHGKRSNDAGTKGQWALKWKPYTDKDTYWVAVDKNGWGLYQNIFTGRLMRSKIKPTDGGLARGMLGPLDRARPIS